MKLCKDCKWCLPPNGRHSRCDNPKNIVIDPVTGEKRRKWEFCSTQRLYGMFEAWSLKMCGKEGKWWEAKE